MRARELPSTMMKSWFSRRGQLIFFRLMRSTENSTSSDISMDGRQSSRNRLCETTDNDRYRCVVGIHMHERLTTLVNGVNPEHDARGGVKLVVSEAVAHGESRPCTRD